MISQRRSISPYVLAALGSITILTFLPLVFYVMLLAATNDVGGPLNLFLIPCSNFIAASFFTLVFFFPLSKLLDRLFQKVGGTVQIEAKSLLFSGVILVLILVAVLVGYTLVMGRILGQRDVDSSVVWLFRFLFLGGVPFLLGGATYWFLLQTGRKMLSNREDKQELREYPKAG